MARPIRLRPRQASDLSVVSRIGGERLQAVWQSLDELNEPVIEASELRSHIQKALNSEEESVPLARQLIALASYCRAFNESPEDAVEGLLKGIEQSDLEDDEKENFKLLAPFFEKLLGQECIILTSKALHLGFDHVNVYQSGNVITDIRPVFDDKREQIIGAVVCQTLRLHFSDDTGIRELSISLDNDDILTLRDACAEALRKAEKSKSLVSDKMNLKAFIVGEESYGYN